MQAGKLGVLHLLEDRDADLVARPPSRKPPLWYAIEGGSALVVEFLLDRGADPLEKFEDRSYVDHAKMMGHDHLVSLLERATHITKMPSALEAEHLKTTPR